MKALAAATLAALLTACGGEMPIDQPPEETLTAGTAAVEAPVVGTCTTHAVRSNTGSTTRHSTDGGKTWLPGPC